MPKFLVHITQNITRYATVEVEAEDLDEANEMASELDAGDVNPGDWDEQVEETDFDVEPAGEEDED